jgi:hypothetical protein
MSALSNRTYSDYLGVPVTVWDEKSSRVVTSDEKSEHPRSTSGELGGTFEVNAIPGAD